jgi:hypothetical protein
LLSPAVAAVAVVVVIAVAGRQHLAQRDLLVTKPDNQLRLAVATVVDLVVAVAELTVVLAGSQPAETLEGSQDFTEAVQQQILPALFRPLQPIYIIQEQQAEEGVPPAVVLVVQQYFYLTFPGYMYIMAYPLCQLQTLMPESKSQIEDRFGVG